MDPGFGNACGATSARGNKESWHRNRSCPGQEVQNRECKSNDEYKS